MTHILDKNGNEIRKLSFQRIWEWISKNKTIFLTAISLLGVVCNAIVNFLIYIHAKGRASYFDIPDEYLTINYKTTVYSIIMYGSFALLYIGVAIWTVRTIMRRKSWIKRIFWAIFMVGVLPLLLLVLAGSVLLDTFSPIFTSCGVNWKKIFYAYIPIVVSHGFLVWSVGYLCAYEIQKDLKRPKEDKKQDKKQGKRTSAGQWKNRDYIILGAIFLMIPAVMSVGYCYDNGVQSVKNKKDFQITIIENHTYVVVMTDGNEAIIEKCDIEENNTLKINTTEYMKVECKNLLLQEKHFINGISK